MVRARLFGRNEETAAPALPGPSRLRRERRSLLRLREELLRDLGGLMLEMVRRDRFRQDLLLERCAELTELDARLAELDGLLAVSFSMRRAPVERCDCGAPILPGASFCPRCGLPVAGSEA
ncbi:MAG: zinc ribbon domain-containing protein [Gaiellaceae bacterium]